MSKKGKHGKQEEGDHDFDEEKLAEIKGAFKIFDVNGDGKISSEELVIAMQVLGNNPTLQEARDIIAEADSNCNGFMEFDEFLNYMKHNLKEPEDVELELMEAFRVFDRNNDRLIDPREVRQLLKQIGEKGTDKQLDEIFEKADLNKDGFIDYEEFVKLMS